MNDYDLNHDQGLEREEQETENDLFLHHQFRIEMTDGLTLSGLATIEMINDLVEVLNLNPIEHGGEVQQGAEVEV